MTMIYVNTEKNRFSIEQRIELAQSLTDAVLIPEIGQLVPGARRGFQVHFVEWEDDSMMAIGGKLLCDYEEDDKPDFMTVNIRVMNAPWPEEIRKQVLENVLYSLARACKMEQPSPTWWVSFEIIDEGSWGSRGTSLSILDLLGSGSFSKERESEIRKYFKEVYNKE